MIGRTAERLATEVLIIGSGAGGAVTAATLAEAGFSVLVIEDGPRVDTSRMATHTPKAMQMLYRNGGLSPILGPTNIAFVEGRCVGGSTEINSAFWHRTPPDAVDRWRDVYAVRDLDPDDFYALFPELEAELGVSTLASRQPPRSSAVLERGATALGWEVAEVPRAQATDPADNQFAPGAKNSMSRTYLPRALRAGAELLANCRAVEFEHINGRVQRVSVVCRAEGGERRLAIEAAYVFVCGGAIQTPVLLRSSGITRNVGDSLRIHPMLKVAAQFEETLDSHRRALPIYQITEFWPDISIGGAVFTPGFLAMTLSENWMQNKAAMQAWRSMALYYVSCRGSTRGTVRPFPLTGEAVVRYTLSDEDRRNLSLGLSRLCEALFAGGARRIYPGLRDHGPLESVSECRSFARSPIAASQMSLSTVHAFSTCPMGENEEVCAADSYGKLYGFENLYIADASMVPDSPGVNPQGTIMALALRNARHFVDRYGS